MTDIFSIDLGYIEDPRKPILPFAADIDSGECAEYHIHPRAQLIYSSKGLLKVYVKDTIWMVSPSQAVWVPAMHRHKVLFLRENHVRNLFIDASVTQTLPKHSFAFDVSTLLRELILKAVSNGSDYTPQSKEWRLIEVLLDELGTIVPTACSLPLSSEPQIQSILDTLISNPADNRSLDEFATIACTSSRNFSRLFVKHVGLSFGQWRKQLRLVTAIEKLSSGKHTITDIAYELGYSSPSSFIQMFSSTFGVPPSKYL